MFLFKIACRVNGEKQVWTFEHTGNDTQEAIAAFKKEMPEARAVVCPLGERAE